MLCALCNSVGRMRPSQDEAERTRRGSAGPRQGPTSESSDACDDCGVQVSAATGDGVLETLSQLARFGLTGQTILARKRA